jgi:hypothetical protein
VNRRLKRGNTARPPNFRINPIHAVMELVLVAKNSAKPFDRFNEPLTTLGNGPRQVNNTVVPQYAREGVNT